MSTQVKKVLIIGAGFAGISAARALGNNPAFTITVIDKRNHHLFQPLLYQVATAGLSPADIAAPIRGILSSYKNIEVVLDEVSEIDRKNKSVTTASGKNYFFDYLIVAGGSTHSYFGHPEWEEFAPGLKTIEQATEIRRRILMAYENAEKATSTEEVRKLLTFVIVGGGPTGVELAGSIAELSRYTLASDFRKIDPSKARVILVEAGPRILAMFPEKLSKKAFQDLEELGVHIWTSSRVTNITAEGAQIGADFIASSNLFWAAGVATSKLNKFFSESLDTQGRVTIKEDLSLIHDSAIFVIGDMANFIDQDKKTLPGLAPVALQQGVHVAKILKADLAKRPRPAFRYFDKGMMATIGRKKAVMQFAGFQSSGLFAWLAWLFVHIYFLIGFRNRAVVLFQWAWSYFAYKRGARLIVSRTWKAFSKD